MLYLNDYDILTGVRLDDYCKQIRTLLGQGVPIGGIGVQGHLHGETFDPKALSNALEKLSEFNLPIRVTEFNMPGQRSQIALLMGQSLFDVGILGGGQLDPGFVAVQSRLDAHAGSRRLSRSGLSPVVDAMAGTSRRPGPVQRPRVFRQVQDQSRNKRSDG